MITLLLLDRAAYMYGVVLHAHPVRGESHNQRNTTREVATVRLFLKDLRFEHEAPNLFIAPGLFIAYFLPRAPSNLVTPLGPRVLLQSRHKFANGLRSLLIEATNSHTSCSTNLLYCTSNLYLSNISASRL